MRGRREFLQHLGGLGLAVGAGCSEPHRRPSKTELNARTTAADAGAVTLFLCGDVMTGRGVDQILPHPSAPGIAERFVTSALDYVTLAEQASGPIPRRVAWAYIWGDVLEEIERSTPDWRIANLETSITRSDTSEAKGINYRMHPANIRCITVADLDCCVLANNHVLDWGRAGLAETLDTLRKAEVRTAGAGQDLSEALQPAAIEVRGGRLLLFGVGSADSGIPPHWAAGERTPGVAFIPELSTRAAQSLAQRVQMTRRPGDIVVVSIHWGANWGYSIPAEHRLFAHRLVEEGGVDVIHGHSSHHPKGIEVYKGKLVLYGCGDFLNDYEGIGGYEEFRSDLVLMYLPTINAGTGDLRQLDMTAFQIRRFRLQRASGAQSVWLRDTLGRESAQFGAHVQLNNQHRLSLNWM